MYAAMPRRSFLRAAEFVDVDALGFEAAEPPLDHDVVRPAGFPVHALTDMALSQELFVVFTGELAPLV